MPRATSLFVVLILCIAGYYLLTNFHKFRYGFKRSSGYHTFLSSAGVGLIAMSVATGFYTLVNMIFMKFEISFSLGDLVLDRLFNANVGQAEIVVFDVAVLTLLLSLVSPLIYYRSQANQYSAFLRAFSSDCESPEYTQLFFSSLQHGLPILFTMSDRKVYIGYVTEIHAKQFNDVHIIPIFSGYRDKNTLKLIPITPYVDILEDVANSENEEVDLDIFSVCLPIREIIHAHLHDFTYYKKFQDKEKELEEEDVGLKYKYKYTNHE